MRRRIKGFTLIELLVVIAIIALLISILLPSLSRARELSKRLVCAANVKGIGTSFKIYANDNSERWPVPAFKSEAIDDQGINYLTGIGEIGSTGELERSLKSHSATPNQPTVGSTEVSVTRSFWMMVRSGDITVAQFICPSSSTDSRDPTENLELYYDFIGVETISYGYQVPFGPRDTVAREGMDNRQVIVGDKSPYSSEDSGQPNWDVGPTPPIRLDDSPKTWMSFNSFNHGGRAQGEGQNLLFADGHATFHRKPTAGIDNDNIYTLMLNEWSDEDRGRIHGDTVHLAATTGPPYPGQDAFGGGAGQYSSTDSLLYP